VEHLNLKSLFSGQLLNEEQQNALENLSPDASWQEKILVKHRKIIGILIPFTFYSFLWWSLAIKNNYFAYFPERYPMSITMAVGSFIGGATSEGGGAVAFPVMTLALHIKPAVARDFSFMVQSCGEFLTFENFTYVINDFPPE